MISRPRFLLALAFVFVACKTPGNSTTLSGARADLRANAVAFTVLQINDVYEINAVESGRRGGLARVATLKKRLLAENPNLITVLPGDFLSPSAMGATKVGGQPVAGQQMIAVLNALGLDYAAFGNHEFDVTEPQLLARIAESKFKWLGANVTDASGKLFPTTTEDVIVSVKNANGDEIKVALFGVCTDMAKKPFVKYRPALAVAQEEADKLGPQAEVVIALTHLSIAEDKQIAASVPRIDVLLGGHEHENAAVVAGDDNTPIFKADANARTAYVHRFDFDLTTRQLKIESSLVEIDESIVADPEVAAVADEWTKKVFTALKSSGTDPEEVVGKATEMLEGFEALVRNRPTNLTKLLVEAFQESEPEADLVVFGSGSIRIDDRLAPGPITAFDIVRIFPFGGKMILVEIPGEALRKALEQGLANKGSGGFLLYNKATRDDATQKWQIGGQPLDVARAYKVLFNDFLLTGLEKGLPFLAIDKEENKIKKIRDSKEVRVAVVDALKKTL